MASIGIPPSTRLRSLTRLSRPTVPICKRCHSTTSATLPRPPRAKSSSSGPSTSQSGSAESTPVPRLRFAPSPTGALHIGGLRTALYNYLFARQNGGKLLLRVEDTDRRRLQPESIDMMRKSLEWAGLDFDEGYGIGGPYQPYIQSERLDLYREKTKYLLENDHAYECFCSEETLAETRQRLWGKGIKGTYDGRCRGLSEEERRRRVKAGVPHVIRFKSPPELPTMPVDLVFGDIKAHSDSGQNDLDDFILMKTNGYPSYHLANVVDDHEMAITHVLRGDEWLLSLPKHVNLYNAFGWALPQFAHLPCLVNSNNRKLSKRHDAASVDTYRAKGYEPEALLNFLALLSWDAQGTLLNLQKRNHKMGQPSLAAALRKDMTSYAEVFTLPELVRHFDLTRVSKRSAQVNFKKLEFYNKTLLRSRAELLGNDAPLIKLGKLPEPEGPRSAWDQRDKVDDKGVLVMDKEGGSGSETSKELRAPTPERQSLINRFHADLKADEKIAKSDLVNDLDYVTKVFDAELPRVTVLNEMTANSIAYFVEPEYEPRDIDLAQSAGNKYNGERNQEDALPPIYIVRHFISVLEEELAQDRRAAAHADVTEDLVWDCINQTTSGLGVYNRSKLMPPLRYALTRLKSGPPLPEVMAVLGHETVLRRLKAWLKYVES